MSIPEQVFWGVSRLSPEQQQKVLELVEAFSAAAPTSEEQRRLCADLEAELCFDTGCGRSMPHPEHEADEAL
jgi:hypothetical protein